MHPPYLIIFKFAAAQRLNRVCEQLRVLPVMIPLKNPLAVGSKIMLFLTSPQTDVPVVLYANVVRQTETGSEIVLENQPLKSPVPNMSAQVCETGNIESSDTVSFQWLRDAVSDKDVELKPEPEADVPGNALTQKQTLSSAERQRVAPAGEWIMKLARAMLRTGYYDPGHPGAFTAKQGLYDEFVEIMADSPELLLTIEETGGATDIVITGILDEPIGVRTVVGKGSAALFVPKLFEYFEKKKLLSIAIKKEISRENFDAFVNIMSDPKVDKSNSSEAGGILTADLVKHNITEISAVFDNDQLNFEKNLPWRVEIAMQRLAKDLKLLPMFTGISRQALWKMKQQSVEDIIRPLRHPRFFNEFLVNCYIIAQNVTDMEPEEIEQILVNSFPAGLLLPTSTYTFEELDWLNEKSAVDPDNHRIARRLEAIKRILKLMARRVIVEDISGAHLFLAYLYDNAILSFEELPADARYVINTRTMARDVGKNSRAYADALAQAKDHDEAIVYMKCFRRVVPLLIENRDWDALQTIAQSLAKTGPDFSAPSMGAEDQPLEMEGDHFPDENRDDEGLFEYVFFQHADKLCSAYESADSHGRTSLDLIFTSMGYFGIQIMGRILSESTDRDVRARVVEKLGSRALDARKWVKGILQDQNRPWYVQRNALMILGKVSSDPSDAELALPFLRNDHPRLRLEALNAAVILKPGEIEDIVIDLIKDPDSRISWRALKAVTELPVKSPGAVDRLFDLLGSELSREGKTDGQGIKLAGAIMNAIWSLPDLTKDLNLEDRLIKFVKPIAFTQKKRLSLLKGPGPDSGELQVIKAAIPLFSKIGSDLSVGFLKDLARAHPGLADQAIKAAGKIDKQPEKGI